MRKSQFVRNLSLFVFSAVFVAACGGGGGGGSTPDTTPNSFSFSADDDAAVGSFSDSENIPVAGIDASASISISGGTYSVNGGEFTSGTGTVSVNDTVQVRVTASTEFGETSEATLTIGGVEGTYTVTTAEPDDFTFGAEDDAAVNSEFISGEVTLRGITGSAPIIVTNGQYSIAGGEYVSGEGTIEAGQTVRVRTTSPGEPLTDKTVTLTIGGVEGEYVVTTMADTEAPVVNIVFPPENSMTQSESILVRGTATDLSAISRILIVATSGEVEATSSDEFATWEALVPLNDGNNTLTITSFDALNNLNEAAGEVRLLLDDDLGFFPDDQVELTEIETLVVDEANNRLLVSGGAMPEIHEIELGTGTRRLFSHNATPNSDDTTVEEPTSILMRETDAVVLDTGSNMIYSLDLINGERTLISSNAAPTGSPEFGVSLDMIFDPANSGRVIVSNWLQIITVDLDNGVRELLPTNGIDLTTTFFNSTYYHEQLNKVFLLNQNDFGGASIGVYELNLSNSNEIAAFSTNLTPADQLAFNRPTINIASYPGSNALFVGDSSEQRVVKVDLLSGEREVFIDNAAPNALGFPQGTYSVLGKQYLLVPNIVSNPDNEDELFGSIHAVDVVNGNRVIISKWRGDDS